MHAVNMVRLCERFGCLPSAIYDEDAGFLRMLELEALVREAGGEGG